MKKIPNLTLATFHQSRTKFWVFQYSVTLFQFLCIYFFAFSVCILYAFRHEVHFLFFLFCFVFFCTSIISFCNFFTFLLLLFYYYFLISLYCEKYSTHTQFLHLNSIHSCMYIGMRFHLNISSPCSAFIRFLFLFSLCLFDLQLLFLNTCQKVINGVG